MRAHTQPCHLLLLMHKMERASSILQAGDGKLGTGYLLTDKSQEVTRTIQNNTKNKRLPFTICLPLSLRKKKCRSQEQMEPGSGEEEEGERGNFHANPK